LLGAVPPGDRPQLPNEVASQPWRALELRALWEIEAAGKKLRFEIVRFGPAETAPKGGHSLFISMHGGGGAPSRVNDGQWTNQIRLAKGYAPTEGIYVAPRGPTDSWNLWHEAHVDVLFARLIEDFVALEGVNPNRVYLMGYSAGGDGVYQLAPRMADWWAAAAMSAGHPNETQPFGLRNVPFALQVGGLDAAYNRNRIAGEWKTKLDALQAADIGGLRALITHAKDNEAKAFYEKYGFESSPLDEFHLMLLLKDVRQIVMNSN
jgi:hypothetical protein